MPQHGRHNAAAADQPVQRFGGISVETALVLALIILIAGGSLLVHTVLPSKRETTTVVGDKKVRVTQVGKGGVLPGPVEPRAIPVVVPTPVATIAAPLPVKTRKPKPTATAVPTATTDPGGVNPLPGGGGGGGGGGQTCTILILCKPGETPTASADPGDSGQVDATPAPSPAATPAATPKKKKRTSTTAPAAAAPAAPPVAP